MWRTIVLNALFWTLVTVQVATAQYRPGGNGVLPQGDIGRLSLELPMKTPVYTVTVQVYLGEQQVATRSLKKDSLADKSRLTDIRNLKEGLYTLKIESPGMPDLLQQVYIRNEKEPVRIYIDYPQNVPLLSSSGVAVSTGPAGMNELLLRIERLEQRIEFLQSRPSSKPGISSRRTKKPSSRQKKQVQQSISQPEPQIQPETMYSDPVQQQPVQQQPVQQQPVQQQPIQQQPVQQQPVQQQPQPADNPDLAAPDEPVSAGESRPAVKVERGKKKTRKPPTRNRPDGT